MNTREKLTKVAFIDLPRDSQRVVHIPLGSEPHCMDGLAVSYLTNSAGSLSSQPPRAVATES